MPFDPYSPSYLYIYCILRTENFSPPVYNIRTRTALRLALCSNRILSALSPSLSLARSAITRHRPPTYILISESFKVLLSICRNIARLYTELGGKQVSRLSADDWIFAHDCANNCGWLRFGEVKFVQVKVVFFRLRAIWTLCSFFFLIITSWNIAYFVYLQCNQWFYPCAMDF